MAVNARFLADFANFKSAIASARGELQTFEGRVGSVEKTLNRMTDAYSGRPLIREALLAVEAVDRIGGSSKLTAQELQRVGTQAQEAVAKLRAMGQDVPANLQALADKVTPIPGHLSLSAVAADQLKGAFLGMAGAFSATAVIDRAVNTVLNLGRAAIDGAGRLVDLAGKTDLSVGFLQKLDIATKQSGDSLDAATSAAFKLGARLSGGSGSVRNAAEELGLSLQGLQRLKPDEQFERVVVALEHVDSVQERNRLGTELFGRSFEGVAATVSEGYENIASQADGATERQLRALDRAGDAWERFKDRALRSTQSFLGGLTLAAEQMEEAGILATIERLATAAIGGSLTGGGALGGALSAVGILSGGAERRAALEDFAKLKPLPSHTDAAKSVETYAQRLKAAQDEVAKLTAVERAEISAALELGESQEKIADRFGLSEDAIRRYVDGSRGASKASEEFSRSQEALWDDLHALDDVLGKITEKMEEQEIAAQKALALDDIQQGNRLLAERVDLLDQFTNRNQNVFGDLPEVLRRENVFGPSAPPTARGFNFSDFLKKSFAPTVMQALTGGGNVLDSIAGVFGEGLTQKLFANTSTGLGKALSGGLSKVLGDTIGGAVSGLLPGIGSLLGPAISGIGKLFGKLFGGEGRQANDIRDKFIDAAGGITVLAEQARQAGTSVDFLLRAPAKVKDVEAAIARLQGQLGVFADEQLQDQERLTAAIQKYGFSFDQLGPAFKRQELNKQALELIEDWRVLVASGIELTTVNEKMATSVNKYVQTALKTGQEVPIAFQPILEKMAEQGALHRQLTDEENARLEAAKQRAAELEAALANAQSSQDTELLNTELNKQKHIIDSLANASFSNLEESGIQFTETMTQGFDRVITKLDELIEKMVAAGTAMDRVGSPSIDVATSVAPYPDAFTDVPSFANGTRGRYLNFAGGTMVKLHNRERVMTEGESAAQDSTALLQEFQGLRRDLAKRDDRLVFALRDAVLIGA